MPGDPALEQMAETTKEVFARTQLHLSKQQTVGWVLLLAGLLIQAAFLAFLIVITVHIQQQISTCQTEANVTKCPTSTEVVPIWVTLAVSAAFGLVFVLAAGFAFTKAKV